MFVTVMPRSKTANLPIVSMHQAPPAVAIAIGTVAHKKTPPNEWKAGMQCLRDLARRKPEIVDEDGWAHGAVALVIETKAGLARVVDVEGMKGEDDEATTCLRERTTWLSGSAFPAEGAEDGLIKMEWGYAVGTRKDPP